MKQLSLFSIKNPWILFLLPGIFFSCKNQPEVDAIFFNGKIYIVDQQNTTSTAMAVKDGKILKTGNDESMLSSFQTKNKIDLHGKPVYPGFFDAHCHFFYYSLDLSQADLKGTSSWNDVLSRIKMYAETHPDGWIIGRGWDQNDWQNKSFPDNDSLNKLFSDRPVLLTRVDGHACIVNDKVLTMAKISAQTNIAGGEVILLNGKPTGVLLDNAKDSVQNMIPPPNPAQIEESMLKAQQNCFAVGLTSLDDCGLKKNVIDAIDTLQHEGKLKMRIYAMVADDEDSKNYYFTHGIYKTDHLDVRAIKYYSDGALGSRGALLLKPYSDAPNESGLQLKPTGYFQQQAQLCYDHGFQMCTHAIGDSANRMMLHVYANTLKGPNDRRWRIEHSQVIAPGDFDLFHQYNIIPSVQTTHATSDMYWAMDRLGAFRIKGAYAYETLLKQNGWLPNGSDFPVEDINPLFGFYAGVTRQDQHGFPTSGFQKEDGLTREQALRAMTIWAAMANFEENEKGSLEPGKFADFVILDNDIMTMPEENIFRTKVLATYVGGERVYGQ